MKNGPINIFAFLGMIELFNKNQIEGKLYLSTKKIISAFNKKVPLALLHKIFHRRKIENIKAILSTIFILGNVLLSGILF